jgi:hypothetical protein
MKQEDYITTSVPDRSLARLLQLQSSVSLIDRYGLLVARHPLKVILLSLLFTAICSLGLIKFR